ncbi:MAG: DUF47 domain-containing protein [Acidimicrobiales bacterium]
MTHGRLGLEAVIAFEGWSSDGDADQAQRVRALEGEADDARRVLAGALRTALSTPIDQEDLYILSERCDRIVNAVKNIVDEAGALAWAPDAPAAEMARSLRRGMEALVSGFIHLADDPDRAAAAADVAVQHTRTVEQTYRSAMARLQNEADLRVVFTSRELYRSYGRSADLIVAVADRLWYAVLSGT